MICDKCEELGHYWFAPDFFDEENEGEAADKELERLIGMYAWCDMREVYRLSTPCQCGCHEQVKSQEEKLKGSKGEYYAEWDTSKVIWGVFHTDLKQDFCFANYVDEDEAKQDVNERNRKGG